MAEWIEFSEAYVLAALPSDVRAAYDAWLTANPGKAGRLEALRRRAVHERQGRGEGVMERGAWP